MTLGLHTVCDLNQATLCISTAFATHAERLELEGSSQSLWKTEPKAKFVLVQTFFEIHAHDRSSGYLWEMCIVREPHTGFRIVSHKLAFEFIGKYPGTLESKRRHHKLAYHRQTAGLQLPFLRPGPLL